MIKALIYKDLLQAFKDKKSIILSFILPIILIALFALVYGEFDSGTTDRAQNLIVCNEDHSTLSQELINALKGEIGLNIREEKQDIGRKMVLDGKYPALFLIGNGFADSLAQGKNSPLFFLYDEAKKMEMGLTQQALMSIVMPFIGEQGGKMQIHHFIDEKYAYDLPEEMINEIHQDIDMQLSGDNSNNANSGLITEALSVKENTPWGLIQAFAGTSVMMLLFSISGMGSALVREREQGTLKRILYSPLKPWNIIIARLLGSFIFALIQMSILVVFTFLVFQLDIFRHFAGFILMIIGTAFAAAGLGIFIATIAKSQKQVESLSLIVIIVMSALGGSMIPLFIFPDFLKTIAHFTINYWSIDGFYKVLGRDVGFLSYAKNVGILFLYGGTSALIAILVFNKRLKKDF